ncbi:chitobiase/beta-hexosaminidase C-terminal domain-containing protein [Ferruginibacter sp.]
MQRTRNIIFNICFTINCLLVFFLIFQSRIAIPSWLQVMGRMHTLLLHFPITLLVLYIFWTLVVDKKNNTNELVKNIGNWLLLVSAFTAAFAALMGLFLSKEDGYDADALQWHKWSGISIAIITSLWYAYKEKIKNSKGLNTSVAVISLAAIIFTGHQGAEISHGQNYLLAPVLPEKQEQKVLMENAIVYANMVQPILKTKCYSCHNTSKAKGQLVMETEELLLKGGKNGKLWDSTAADYGLLLSRLHLPVDAKKHMPPTGKPQLTEQETQILYSWIKAGANFKTKVIDLAATDTLRLIANAIFNTIETDDYDFAAADEKKVKNLNTNYRNVAPLAKTSPALGAEFFSAQSYLSEQLKELLTVKEQVVSLSLNKMPVKDEELKTISQFSNLRKLNLSFTNITGTTLNELSKLKELRQLSLSGTIVKKDDILKLSSLKKLSHLFIWNTALTETDIAALKNAMKDIAFEKGFKGDTTILKLNAPILLNEEQIINTPITLKLKHYINGVSIRYTLDGTEPDSITSKEFSNDIMLTQNTTVKAKAFKKGWLSSAVMEGYFFSSKYKPDSVVNLLPADEQYKGDGAKTLIDLVKGEANNFKSGKWLGFKKNKMESLLLFNAPVNVKSVTLSALIDIGGYIMPPVTIEVWGGNEARHLKLLRLVTPEQPTVIQPGYLKAFQLSFKPATVKYLKIVAVPVSKLPAWHPGKGDKGWVFADEVFVN